MKPHPCSFFGYATIGKPVKPTKSSISKAFGKLVKRRRLDMKITLPELAKEIGISKGLLSDIENGKGNPCLHTLEKMATTLNRDIMIGPNPFGVMSKAIQELGIIRLE